MKLKMIREHYQSNDNIVWTPKRPFATEQQIQDELGFDPAKCGVYKCTFCDMLHISPRGKYR